VLAAGALVLAQAVTARAADDVEALLARLARPAPDAIGFAEVRFSPLVEQPLLVSGRLEYAGPGRLSRIVSSPYEERTDIVGDEVRVSREGERDRRFSLRRAPELRGLLTSFGAILAGDADALEENFSLSLADSELPGRAWVLSLQPKAERLRDRLGSIRVHGSADRVACIAMGLRPEESSVILLGEKAEDLPQPLTPEALEARCSAID